MRAPLKNAKFASFAILAILAITVSGSGCGRQNSARPPLSLAQQSEGMSDNADYLCRLDFKYPLEPGSTIQVSDFIAKWGRGRTVVKKAILSDCTDPLLRPKIAGLTCSRPEVFDDTQCVHSSLLPARQLLGASVGLPRCRLTYLFRFNRDEFPETEEALEATGNTVTAAARSVVDQCASRRGGDLNGCTEALMNGELSCASR